MRLISCFWERVGVTHLERDAVAKVFIADSFPLFTTGLRSLLEQQGHYVVSRSGDTEELLTEISDFQPDVIFLESRVEENRTSRVLEYVRQNRMSARILLAIDATDDYDSSQLSRTGIACIVGMRQEPQTYLACLWTVLNDNICCSPGRTGVSAAAAVQSLSPRELQIAILVAQGKRNQEIAELTSISVGTVKIHLTRVFKKLGVQSRVELTLALRRNVP